MAITETALDLLIQSLETKIGGNGASKDTLKDCMSTFNYILRPDNFQGYYVTKDGVDINQWGNDCRKFIDSLEVGKAKVYEMQTQVIDELEELVVDLKKYRDQLSPNT